MYSVTRQTFRHFSTSVNAASLTVEYTDKHTQPLTTEIMIVGRLTVVGKRVTKPFPQDKIQKAHFCFSLVRILDLFRLVNFLHQHVRQLTLQFRMQYDLEQKVEFNRLIITVLTKRYRTNTQKT